MVDRLDGPEWRSLQSQLLIGIPIRNLRSRRHWCHFRCSLVFVRLLDEGPRQIPKAPFSHSVVMTQKAVTVRPPKMTANSIASSANKIVMSSAPLGEPAGVYGLSGRPGG